MRQHTITADNTEFFHPWLILDDMRMVLLKKISIRSLNQSAVNLDTEHCEPIVREGGITESFDYGSLEVVIEMKRLDSHAAFVRVDSLTMLLGEQYTRAWIFASAYDNYFSRIAISEETDSFKITILLKSATKKKVVETLNRNCQITMEIVVELTTANYVSTKIKCRGLFWIMI